MLNLQGFNRRSLAGNDSMGDNSSMCTLDNESSDNDDSDDGAFQRSDSFTVQMCPSYIQRMRTTAKTKAESVKPESRHNTQNLSPPSKQNSTSGVRKWFTSLMTRSQSVSELNVTAQRVRYIFGCTPAVKWRKRSLNELQQPLLDIYSRYVLGKCSSAPAEVRILTEGVRVRYYASPEAGRPFEFLGDFADLAHYAAVRCVVEQSPRNVAFVPFGTTLFETPPEVVPTSVLDAPDMVGDVAEELMSLQNHPPLFVCLMRNSGEKSLRCHMFVCSSAEQAVAIAREVRNVMVSTMTRSKASNVGGSGSGSGVRRWETFLRTLVGGTAGKDKSRVCPLIPGRRMTDAGEKVGVGVPRSRSFVHVNRIYRDMLSGCEVIAEWKSAANSEPGHVDTANDNPIEPEYHKLTKEAEIQFTMEELQISPSSENNDWETEWGTSTFLP